MLAPADLTVGPRPWAVAALALLGLVLACGSPLDQAGVQRRCVEELSGPREAAAEAYLGLSGPDAGALARADGLELRVLGEDARCADRTDDRRQDRVDVYLVDGRVVFAATG